MTSWRNKRNIYLEWQGGGGGGGVGGVGGSSYLEVYLLVMLMLNNPYLPCIRTPDILTPYHTCSKI